MFSMAILIGVAAAVDRLMGSLFQELNILSILYNLAAVAGC